MNHARFTYGEYAISVVQDARHLEALEEEWNQVASRSTFYTPWLIFAWHHYFFRHFLEESDLFILLFYKHDELIAIAPLVQKRERYKGIFTVNKLELMGNLISPIRSLVWGDGAENEMICDLAFHFFQRDFRDWDVIEFDRFPGAGDLLPSLRRGIMRHHFTHRVLDSSENWYTPDIDYPYSTYHARLSSRLRKSIRIGKRRLQHHGNWQFKILDDYGRIDEYLDICDELRHKSWKASERARPFIREFCKHLARSNWLHLGALYLDQTPIALQKWVIHAQTAYVADIVYDERYCRYSPGNILLAEMARYAIQQHHVNEIDFMIGVEPYKREWAAKKRPLHEVTVFNTSIKGRMLSTFLLHLFPRLERNKYTAALKKRVSEHLQGGG